MPDALITITDGQTDNILDDITAPNIISDLHRKMLKDNLETFQFTTFENKRYFEHLAKRNRIIIPDEDGNLIEFILYRVAKQKDVKGILQAEVRSVASYQDDLTKSKIFSEHKTSTETAEWHTIRALSGTIWKPGKIAYKRNRSINFEERVRPLGYLKRIAREFGLELKFRIEHDGNKITGRYVDLVEKVGEWRGYEAVFGKDITEIERIEQTNEVITALQVYGPKRDDGSRLEVLVEDKDALRRWNNRGQHLIDEYEPQTDNRDISLDELTKLGKAELDKRINAFIQYRMEMVVLENVPGLENKIVRFGDTIRAKDEAFDPPLYVEARLHTVERSIKVKSRKYVELGDFVEFTEDEVKAIWKEIQKELREKIDMDDVLEVTYPKDVIDEREIKIGLGIEAKSIKVYKNILDADKQSMDKRYDDIYHNPALIGTVKNQLSTAKADYDSTADSLLGLINAVGDEASEDDKQAVDAEYDVYKVKYATLAQAFEQATDAIGTKKDEGVRDYAKEKIDKANEELVRLGEELVKSENEIDKAKGLIKDNTDAIAAGNVRIGKAESSLATLGENLVLANNRIDAANNDIGEIKEKLETAEGEIETLQTELDNLEFDNTNLAYDTEDERVSNSFIQYDFDLEELRKQIGKKVTVSVDVRKRDAGLGFVELYLRDVAGALIMAPRSGTYEVNENWQRLSYTFEVQSNILTKDNITMTIRSNSSVPGNTVAHYVLAKKMKLEKGDKETFYTPNPSDVEQKIKDAQAIIDEVTSNRDGETVLAGTLVTNNIIAENATLTGTFTGPSAIFKNIQVKKGTFKDMTVSGVIGAANATFQRMTTEDMIAKDATLQNSTVTGILNANNSRILKGTFEEMIAKDAIIQNATVTGTIGSENAVFKKGTIEDMTALRATIKDSIITGTLNANNATFEKGTFNNMTAVSAILQNATVTGTMTAANSTILKGTFKEITAVDANIQNAIITGRMVAGEIEGVDIHGSQFIAEGDVLGLPNRWRRTTVNKTMIRMDYHTESHPTNDYSFVRIQDSQLIFGYHENNGNYYDSIYERNRITSAVAFEIEAPALKLISGNATAWELQTKDSYNHGFIKSGTVGLKFLNGSTEGLQVRNAADTAYSDLHLRDLTVTGRVDVTDRVISDYLYFGKSVGSTGRLWATASYTNIGLASTKSYVRINNSTGQMGFVIDGSHVFSVSSGGSKVGGTITIDDELLGMSPVDSPQYLIVTLLQDISLVADVEKEVKLEKRFAKAVANYSVFPNRDIKIRKDRDRFYLTAKVDMIVDCKVEGERIEFEGRYWTGMDEDNQGEDMGWEEIKDE